jgi:hypothetical protein
LPCSAAESDKNKIYLNGHLKPQRLWVSMRWAKQPWHLLADIRSEADFAVLSGDDAKESGFSVES